MASNTKVTETRRQNRDRKLLLKRRKKTAKDSRKAVRRGKTLDI